MLAEINKLLGKLATTNRYSDTRLINPESVLEHTGYVTLLSMFIGLDLSKAGEDIKGSELLRKALLHDVEESLTGDVIHPTKYASFMSEKGIKDYGSECANQILKDLPGYPYTHNLWIYSKLDKEGFIVSLADKLSVLYKINQEVNGFGNKNLLDHLNIKGILSDLEFMKSESEDCFTRHLTLNEYINEGISICKKI